MFFRSTLSFLAATEKDGDFVDSHNRINRFFGSIAPAEGILSVHVLSVLINNAVDFGRDGGGARHLVSTVCARYLIVEKSKVKNNEKDN